MIRASALYIVIVIALVIGLLCSSLIVVAYFYRLQYQKTFRHDLLQHNFNSGVNILLATPGDEFINGKALSLFGDGNDSVFLKKTNWGLYDAAMVKAFIQHDTLYKTFLVATMIDSTKWAALYVIDEDRPLSVSGKTSIKGDVFIPKAGIKEAYVDNKSYQGERPLVGGKTRNSEKKLPLLSNERLAIMERMLKQEGSSNVLKTDAKTNSFLADTRVIHFGKHVTSLQNVKLSGNIIVLSDTTLIIENTAKLENIMVFARAISVKAGFNGTCQLFATDSITVEKNCVFNYPSGLGIMRFEENKISAPLWLYIGENTRIDGVVFSYDISNSRDRRPLIDLGKNSTINGQVYSSGLLGLKDGVSISGSVFTNRFLYQSTFTRYENYIINTSINSSTLSPYYLTSDLIPVSGKKKKVLQWLEAN